MIRAYTITRGRINQYKNPTFNEIAALENLIWIDLQSPTTEEKEFVEKTYKIEFFTSQELQEIESSSRFLETDETVEIVELGIGRTAAQNHLDAKVVSITEIGGRARVGLLAGQPLVAEVSVVAVRDLGLVPGARVTATWKAAATRLAPR